MDADFKDRRSSARSSDSERIRIRPADRLQAEKICDASSRSRTELYFLTKTGSYVAGMEVFVTRNYRPDDSASREEKAVVVRVDSLGGGHVGVAIRVKTDFPKRVLFVCIGNACRSVMAEALARHFASDVIAASSAGLAPLGYVCPSTRAVLTEIGISSDGQHSKPLEWGAVASTQLLINMSGQPISHVRIPVEDWQIDDPFGRDIAIYRNTRDQIERRVVELATRLRASAAAQ